MRLSITRPLDFQRTLGPHQSGGQDPTTRLGERELWRAARTPLGPGTLQIVRDGDAIVADAWGPGAPWLLDRVGDLLGDGDDASGFVAHDEVVARAAHRFAGLRIGRSLSVLHALVPMILGQRVTGGEALTSWAKLCRAQGEPAPGPAGRADRPLLLPPDPGWLAEQPSWWFHPLGVERHRAETIIRVARHARRLEEAVALPWPAARARLEAVAGVGAWTAASAAARAFGDPDAVAVGDFHLKHVVAWALAGRARGTDEEMLSLLAPYAPQRDRVVRLLVAAGISAPAHGPRQRILPMSRW